MYLDSLSLSLSLYLSLSCQKRSWTNCEKDLRVYKMSLPENGSQRPIIQNILPVMLRCDTGALVARCGGRLGLF